MNCSKRASVLASILLALLLFSTANANAQVAFGPEVRPLYRVDLYAATRERWRGIRRNATPVANVDGMIGARWKTLSLTAGAWAMVEIGGTGDEVLPALQASDRGPSQWTAWAQGAFQHRHLTLTPPMTATSSGASSGVIRRAARVIAWFDSATMVRYCGPATAAPHPSGSTVARARAPWPRRS